MTLYKKKNKTCSLAVRTMILVGTLVWQSTVTRHMSCYFNIQNNVKIQYRKYWST